MLSDDRGKDTSVFDISGNGTTSPSRSGRLLSFFNHKCVITGFVVSVFDLQCLMTSSMPSLKLLVSWMSGPVRDVNCFVIRAD